MFELQVTATKYQVDLEIIVPVIIVHNMGHKYKILNDASVNKLIFVVVR